MFHRMHECYDITEGVSLSHILLVKLVVRPGDLIIFRFDFLFDPSGIKGSLTWYIWEE